MDKIKMAKYYQKAAEYLREHGWLQRSGGVNGGPRCAVGALLSVTTVDDPVNSILATLSAPVTMDDLVSWNDAPGRTAQDVIAFFEQAAIELGQPPIVDHVAPVIAKKLVLSDLALPGPVLTHAS